MQLPNAVWFCAYLPIVRIVLLMEPCAAKVNFESRVTPKARLLAFIRVRCQVISLMFPYDIIVQN
jgi:hypothetical protein